jgi:hypothetical protein
MGNGQWGMGNGKRRKGNGQWGIGNGEKSEIKSQKLCGSEYKPG